MNCVLCNTRKEKRFCLALHDRICARCCGVQRELTLDCPSDCPYLKQARDYNHSQPELLEDERWFAHVKVGDDFLDAHARLLDDLVEGITQITSRDGSLRDRDVIEALTALIRSFETRINSGLHYAATRPSLAQQRLIGELREVLAVYDEVRRRMGYTNLRDSDALKALVFILRIALDRSSGRPLSRGFLDFLREEFMMDGGTSSSLVVLQ